MELDPGIKPLVHLLWENGYKTIGSCQGGPEHPKVHCGRKSDIPGKAFVTVEAASDEDEKEKLSDLLTANGYKNYNVYRNRQWGRFGFYFIQFDGELSI